LKFKNKKQNEECARRKRKLRVLFFEASRLLARRVLVNIRTTTANNSASQRRSTTIKIGHPLARGFAQMTFWGGLVVQAQFRTSFVSSLVLNWLSLQAAGAHFGFGTHHSVRVLAFQSCPKMPLTP